MKNVWIPLASLAMIGLVASATPGPFDSYVSGATAIVKNPGQQPVLDQGGVLCNKTEPVPSIGGGCVLFGPWDSIRVADNLGGPNVAFQVCIDNNGDAVCGGAFGQEQCFDDLFFSHNDAGQFFNPLGRLPQGFRPGCPGGPWPGYVVFLCEGVHGGGGAPAVIPHAHAATAGSITGTLGGTGFGNFCSPPFNAPPKPYEVL